MGLHIGQMINKETIILKSFLFIVESFFFFEILSFIIDDNQ